MAKENLTRYVWLIDTIRSYGTITRSELDRLWRLSSLSNGRSMSRRTFYNDRLAIEEIFGITIECNPVTYEYFIDQTDEHRTTALNWMLDSASMGDVLNDARSIGHKIFLEEVPSAREHLPLIVEALKHNQPVAFTYRSYARVNPSLDNRLEPYFLKFFKQRWYITGRNIRQDALRTYALDRMSDLTLLPGTFEIPAHFDAEEYVKNSYGIIFDEGLVKDIAIRTDPRQAKYFRSVPLHSSQSEIIHDTYSIFNYRLKLTPDFVQELLSYGPKITVINPPELRAMIVTSLRDSLNNYN